MAMQQQPLTAKEAARVLTEEKLLEIARMCLKLGCTGPERDYKKLPPHVSVEFGGHVCLFMCRVFRSSPVNGHETYECYWDNPSLSGGLMVVRRNVYDANMNPVGDLDQEVPIQYLVNLLKQIAKIRGIKL